jgi:hypothetical protein
MGVQYTRDDASELTSYSDDACALAAIPAREHPL